jgi:phosphohistidine swiveling domain-containing protein
MRDRLGSGAELAAGLFTDEGCVQFMTEKRGQVLQIPEGFPVHWENPSDAEFLWVWDDVHSPVPGTPLQQSVNAATGRGIRRAARELQMPRGGPRRDFNGYAYIAYLPTPPAQDEVDRHERVLDDAIPDLRRRWDEEFLPGLDSDLDTLRSLGEPGADPASLAARLDQAVEIVRDHYYIHFIVIFTLFGATGRLARLYKQITGTDDEMSPYLILQGRPNKSVEAGRALKHVAATARSQPPVATLFDNPDPHSILRRLRRTPEATDVVAQFERYLGTYGHRSVAEDISGPTWIEDPAYPLLALRGYVQGAPRDLDAELAGQAVEADRMFQDALGHVAPNDSETREAFERIVEICRAVWPLREDHAHYIDQQSVAFLRRILLACGEMLASRGTVPRVDDVFYLELPEIQEALGSGEARFQDRVRDRRAVRMDLMRSTPPRFLGTMPEAGPALDSELAKFFNPMGNSSGGTGETSKVLRGTPGSPGAHIGPARVVLSTEEFERVQPGDVLVTRTTNPSWTPLFGVIGALVTDSGGVLSHGAIVAREVGLPAVVGTKGATEIVRDGDIVTVDGSLGLVTLA